MIFDEVFELMTGHIDPETLTKSLADVHLKGVFSLVVGGTENGSLTRIFIANKKIKPFDIQFHSHRYALTIGVVHGCFEHHVAIEETDRSYYNAESVRLKTYVYHSPLNGGNGLVRTGVSNWRLESTQLPVGSEIFLPSDLVHSVSCSKGTIWIVKEHGFVEESSVVLGNSFITEGLYNQPQQYQVNDNFQLVLEKLKKLVDN